MIRLLQSICFPLLSKRTVLGRIRGNVSCCHRRALLEHFGAKVGATTRLRSPVHLINCGKDFSRLAIGENVFIGHNVLLDLAARIEIGDNVTLSMNVVVSSHIDVGKIPLAKLYPRRLAPVRIREDVYIGTGAIIFAGVTIGPHAVVGAGAVVREDVAPYSVVGGVPARVLKTIDPASLT